MSDGGIIAGIVMSVYLVGLPIVGFIFYAIKSRSLKNMRAKPPYNNIFLNILPTIGILAGTFTFEITHGALFSVFGMGMLTKMIIFSTAVPEIQAVESVKNK